MATAGSGSEKTSVQVALRIRPLTAQDLATLPSRFQRNVVHTSSFSPNQVTVQGEKKQTFNFDCVFGTESTQKEVYDKVGVELVDKFLEGYNVTILAYGQTSSGKTFTMGTADSPSQSSESQGIIPRAMNTLFNYINSAQFRSRKFQMKVSFIEIYNEELIDLLAEGDEGSRPQVIIREDSKGNILYSGVNEIRVNSVEEVMGHLARGSLVRQTGATDMNAQSSRSHAIFSVTLSQQKLVSPTSPQSTTRPSTPTRIGTSSRAGSRMSKRFDDGDWVQITSKFHFVDLAGSERLKRTSAIGDRVKEGISINSGLLALGNVISALGDPNKAKHTTHIPYRDSKLTRLLQDSLGGNAQTLMIACVSPAEYNVAETVNTLKYANRARNIKNNAVVNQEESGWHDVEHLQGLVLKLREQIRMLKTNSGVDSGRSTPTLTNGYDSPQHYRRSSTPLSFVTNSDKMKKDSDIDTLEDELSNLRLSYQELTQKHAKVAAELAKHQDNADYADNATPSPPGNSQPGSPKYLSSIKEEDEAKLLGRQTSDSFQQAVEPVIEEYEKSISALESQLSLARAELNHSETSANEKETKLREAEQLIEENDALIKSLRNKVTKLGEREQTNDMYIKDLEHKLESHADEQKKDQNTITDLRAKIQQLKTTSANSESYIHDLEFKLSRSDDAKKKLAQTIEKLEKRLQQREADIQKLESKLKAAEAQNEDMVKLGRELGNRDKRISQLESKVEELISELDRFRNATSRPSSISKAPTDSNFSITTKLSALQQTHQATMAEFTDLKAKYAACLDEINDLTNQLNEAKLVRIEMTDATAPSSPASLITPRSAPPSFGDNDLLSPSSRIALRKARSLSAEIQGAADRRDATAEAIVQKLQIELKQLESLHDDKAQGLEAVRQEFARLEMSHREAIEIVEELREEIKHRDALAQMQVMSVMNAEHQSDRRNSTTASEVDQLEIVQKLREEVEQLTEEQRKTMEVMSEREKDHKHDVVAKLENEIESLKSELKRTIEEKDAALNGKNDDERVAELQSKMSVLEQKLEKAHAVEREENIAAATARLEGSKTPEDDKSDNGEMVTLRLQLEKLQTEIEAKSHTIAALLMPAFDSQHIVRRLEDELQQVKEAQRRLLESKNNSLNNAADENAADENAADENAEGDSTRIEIEDTEAETTEMDKIQDSTDSGISSDDNNTSDEDNDKLKVLEAKAKELSTQLAKAKETHNTLTPRNSQFSIADPTQKSFDSLQEKLVTLQTQIAAQAVQDESVKPIADMVTVLQGHLNTLRVDIKRKYDLIEILKRDLLDKGLLQQKLREKEEEATALKARLEEAEKAEEEVMDEMTSFKTQLETDLEELKTARDNAVAELSTVKSEFSEQKQLVVELENELKTVREELVAVKSSSETVSREHEELGKLLQETISQRNESEKRAKRLEIEVDSFKVGGGTDVDAIRDQLISARHQVEDQNELVLELEAQVAAIEGQRDENLQRISELETTLNEKQALHEDAVALLESTLLDLKNELEEIKKSNKLEQDNVNELEDNLATVQSQLEAARNSEEKKNKVVSDLENKLNVVLDALKDKEQVLATRSAVIDGLETSVSQTRVELQQARSSASVELKNKLSEAEAKLTSKEIKIADLEAVASETQEEIEKLRSTDAKQNELIKSLEGRLATAESARDEEIAKLKAAHKDIADLKLQCTQLQNEIDDAQRDSLIQSYEAVDDALVEDLTNQLKKAHNESKSYRDRAFEFEQLVKQLELENQEQLGKNDELSKQVEMCQKDFESLADEFAEAESKYEDAKELSKKQKTQIAELEAALEAAKRSTGKADVEIPMRGSGLVNPALANLAAANENLRHTNDALNAKITEAEDHTFKLNERIRSLETELKSVDSSKSVNVLNDKIRALEGERDEIKQSADEEKKKLDSKIETLRGQLRTAGLGGNKAAQAIADLNTKISSLENELFTLQQRSREESNEMEKEIARLLELNDKLEVDLKKVEESSGSSTARGTNFDSNDSMYQNGVSGFSTSSLQMKLHKQENTITQQTGVIKVLQEKIVELERKAMENESLLSRVPNMGMSGTDLDAVGGLRLSTSSASSDVPTSTKKSIRQTITSTIVKAPPPMPPPSHPPPPPPTALPPAPHSPPSTPNGNVRPRSDGRSSEATNSAHAELASEIQRLHKKIASMEGETLSSRQQVDKLRTQLADSESEIRVAKKQFGVLQKDKADLQERVKKLEAELSEARDQVEYTKNAIQREKKELDDRVKEERIAKENAEKAKRQLESRMEELIAKRNKFMCF